MSNVQLSTILHALVYFSDVIFSGLKIVVPLLFISKVFKINIRRPDLAALVLAANLLLLTGGTLFLINIFVDTSRTIRQEGEDGLNFMMSMISGPHGYQLLLPIACYALLPHIMWFKKIRSTIYSSSIIVLIWFLSKYIIEYLARQEGFDTSTVKPHGKFPFAEFAWKFVLFISALALVYMIVKRTKNNSSKIDQIQK